MPVVLAAGALVPLDRSQRSTQPARSDSRAPHVTADADADVIVDVNVNVDVDVPPVSRPWLEVPASRRAEYFCRAGLETPRAAGSGAEVAGARPAAGGVRDPDRHCRGQVASALDHPRFHSITLPPRSACPHRPSPLGDFLPTAGMSASSSHPGSPSWHSWTAKVASLCGTCVCSRPARRPSRPQRESSSECVDPA